MSDELRRAYETLDLAPGAPLEEIRAAYRDLARIWHPDRLQNEPERIRERAERKMKELSRAYELLMQGADAEPMADPVVMDFGSRWGYIDELGRTAIHPQFEAARPFVEGLAAVKVADKWGFIDAAGNHRVTPLYEECGDFSEGLAAVRWYGKWGYVDGTGAFVIVPRYQEAEAFRRGAARVRMGARWGVVDRAGRAEFDPTHSGRHLE